MPERIPAHKWTDDGDDMFHIVGFYQSGLLGEVVKEVVTREENKDLAGLLAEEPEPFA